MPPPRNEAKSIAAWILRVSSVTPFPVAPKLTTLTGMFSALIVDVVEIGYSE